MGRRNWVKIYVRPWLDARGSIRKLSPEQRGIFADLIAMAGDSTFGDVGIIQVAPGVGFTDEQLCAMMVLPKKMWDKAKKKLKKEDMISLNGGNSIKIVNFRKYQSEYQRQSVYRKTKTNTPKLQPKVTTKSYNSKLLTDKDKEKDKEKDINNNKDFKRYCSNGFEKWWSIQRKKVGKKQTNEEWVKIIRKASNKELLLDEIILGTENYFEYCDSNDRPFLDPVRFLKREMWKDFKSDPGSEKPKKDKHAGLKKFMQGVENETSP